MKIEARATYVVNSDRGGKLLSYPHVKEYIDGDAVEVSPAYLSLDDARDLRDGLTALLERIDDKSASTANGRLADISF